MRDTFDRCNSISSAVGLNNNMLKDRLLYQTCDDFYVIFFCLSSETVTSKVCRIDGPC